MDINVTDLEILLQETNSPPPTHQQPQQVMGLQPEMRVSDMVPKFM